ncbi:MAG: cytochrome c [Magnetococcales bacterium]|nr:cytochrome c [Magnetococcales bacterium]
MKKAWYLVPLGLLVAVSTPTESVAGEKRCRVGSTRVECPVKTDAQLEKAIDAYEAEGNAMAEGKAGSTYGIAPFDYLTGVGKHSEGTTLTEGDSGYGAGTGKTELWDRVKAPKKGDALYNQWTNNWSPTFKTTLVPGADPNEGKQWYYVYCVGCHGWLLQGDGPNAFYVTPRPRVLVAGDYMNGKTNLELFSVIKGGGEAVDLSPSMPSWGNLMQDQDIWNVVAWIRANADVGPPKSLEDYLNPKSSYKPNPNDVNPLNAAQNADFADAQEMAEATLPGRGVIEGGGYVEGGLRKAPSEVAGKVKGGY